MQQDDDERANKFRQFFGARVKRAREERGLTQRQLSELLAGHRVQLDNSAITRIENGAREPRIREAIVLADVLEFPLSTLGVFDIGGETQFASAEAELKRDMALARRRVLRACVDVHIGFDGIASDSEELEILQRRGVTTAIEWAEKVRDEMAQRFSVDQDETGAINYVPVTDPVHRQVLEIIIDGITANLFRTEKEVFKYADEQEELYRQDQIRRAKETLIEVYGDGRFGEHFQSAFETAEASQAPGVSWSPDGSHDELPNRPRSSLKEQLDTAFGVGDDSKT
ncbi:helix-turn-helix domain-containing protein [Mycobacteroides abscessus]|uniref:helix-turn-helix domain-containing protein n=1 Tax=Mycobacteroides abscessus TaxID=36809 RepID=UPI00092C2C3B|nr:helix-turn-helix transcriptional regulator [Mycobacteroides abscessus]MBN7458326.1 helix-turn-helix transcriptional regulator [Mycobacteroides abscessus subsp. abscessus]MBN7542985.1 helix-turn-helix transcriptional regulator [Mycobacteroides abscessus subsp. abscessus]MBN7568955.1 helix-turn-helix transcriptional regulator [Mycobacteroides abscessus subsp. abscessus]QSM95969.1 helix-turn-helix transcriptional regulator [Mycobacteroides abscessus subsp. abscessus]QSN01000.1 helix-turn-helix